MFQKFFTLWATTAPDAAGDGAAANDGNAMIFNLVFIVAIVAVFYFFIIRPESKRKKAAEKMRNELVVGDEITTTSGIIGRLVQFGDDFIVLETGNERNQIKMVRQAIASKVSQSSQK